MVQRRSSGELREQSQLKIDAEEQLTMINMPGLT